MAGYTPCTCLDLGGTLLWFVALMMDTSIICTGYKGVRTCSATIENGEWQPLTRGNRDAARAPATLFATPHPAYERSVQHEGRSTRDAADPKHAQLYCASVRWHAVRSAGAAGPSDECSGGSTNTPLCAPWPAART